MATFTVPLPLFLPDPKQLKLDELIARDGILAIGVSAGARSAACPKCGARSAHVHSRYCRSLCDLPCQGSIVRIRLRTRRFYCRVEECLCRVFTERLPAVVRPYGRRTDRCREALLSIGYALGGEAGCRLAAKLAMVVSADTILRIISECSPAEATDVKVLGVDDWAWRRGHHYGTLLVDLERRRPIDLLPDREAKMFAEWLQAHPTVQVVSRDRAGAYADGARQGAPDAMQVADRFHLFCNLTQALRRLLERLSQTLQRLRPRDAVGASHDVGGPDANHAAGPNLPSHATKGRENQAVAVAPEQGSTQPSKRKVLFEAVKAAYSRGIGKIAIAREFGIDRRTVRKWLQASELPERAPRRRRSALDPFRPYLQKRWAEGCHNASQLCRELRDRGYQGQRSRVKEYVHSWRATPQPTAVCPRRTMPNFRVVAFWLAKEPDRRIPDEQQWVEAATAAQPHVASAEHLAQQFRRIFTHRNAAALRLWIADTAASGIPELARFASGLERDYDAVVAAVEQPWSNGQVEGHVHRLKSLKRQMYGRSGFRLLRTRVLRPETGTPHWPT